MSANTRTSKSILNASVAFGYVIFTLVLGFLSRKVFLDVLGADVLGLNTTATNLLGFLNLAELGIGSAIAFSLYSPLSNNDYASIKEIIAIQAWLYRRVALFVIIASGILLCFFPLIFAKMNLPLWYAYAFFLIYLFSSLLSYYFNYKQVLLSANQQQYKINHCISGVRLIKMITQTVGLYFFALGIIFWLCMECIGTVWTTFTLHRTVKKEFTWLDKDLQVTRELIQKYKYVVTKIKQIFFHKIAGLVLTQTSPLIIYAYLNLTTVAIYGNYTLIISGLLMLNNTFNSSLTGSIGNLIATTNSSHVQSIFHELIATRYFISSILAFSFYLLVDSFTSLWFGVEYLVDNVSLLLFTIYIFIIMTRLCESFISAYGIFHDIWAPITEAVLNLGLSLILGYHFGLSGILSGVIISLLVIVCCWKPYFLYTRGFRAPISEYLWLIGRNIVLIAGAICLSSICLHYVYTEPSTIIEWLIQAVITTTVISVIHFLIFQLLNPDFRSFSARIINYKKINV